MVDNRWKSVRVTQTPQKDRRMLSRNEAERSPRLATWRHAGVMTRRPAKAHVRDLDTDHYRGIHRVPDGFERLAMLCETPMFANHEEGSWSLSVAAVDGRLVISWAGCLGDGDQRSRK